MPPLLVMLLLLLAAAPAAAQEAQWTERADFGAAFEAAGVTGTFLLYDLEANHYYVYHPDRIDVAVVPASTFKIFNSLVALETGVIADADEVLPWDGVERGWEAWNQDHSLRTAFPVSAVWVYQELARRIGTERMQAALNAAGYGNRDLGGGIDRFWLDGALRISPREQVDLLVRLYHDALPFSEPTQHLAKEILVMEHAKDYLLRGKTGWSDAFTPQVGWFVGWIERDDRPYFFATQIDLRGHEDAPARVAVTRTLLQQMGLLE